LGNLGYREDCKGIFKEKRILTLPAIYILESILYIHQHRSEFGIVKSTHHYNTRQKDDLNQEFIRLSRCQISANYWGVQFYNKLPLTTRSLSPKCLKVKLKDFLLKQVIYSVDEFLSSEIAL